MSRSVFEARQQEARVFLSSTLSMIVWRISKGRDEDMMKWTWWRELERERVEATET